MTAATFGPLSVLSTNSSFESTSSGTTIAIGTSDISDVDNDPATGQPDSYAWRLSFTAGDRSAWVDIDATPGDFDSMDTFAFDVYVDYSGFSDDTIQLYLQAFKSDQTTALTTEWTGPSTNNNGRYTSSDVINAAGIAATPAEWDAAAVRIRYVLSRNMGADGGEKHLYALQMPATYTPTGGGPAALTSPQIMMVS